MGVQIINPSEPKESAYQLDDQEQQKGQWKEKETPFGKISGSSKENFLAQVASNFTAQLNDLKKWRQAYYDSMWTLCDKAYYGYKEGINLDDIEKDFRSNIRIRYAYKQVESQVSKIIPSIIGFDPPCSVFPNDENSEIRELKAKAAQKQLKYNFFQKQNAVELIINWIRQGERLGLSPMKLYWAYEEKESKVVRRPVLDEEGVLVGVQRIEYDEPYTVKDNPENMNVNARRWWWNPDAVDKSTLRYCYEEYWKPLSYIKSSPLYIKSQTKNLSPDSVSGDDNEDLSRTEGQSKMTNTEENMVKITERWDKDFLIVEAGGKIIRYRDNPFDDGIIPYYCYRATILDDQYPGMGTIEPMLDIEELANVIVNQRLDNVHRIINRMLLVSTSSGLNTKRIKFRPMGLIKCLNPDKVQPFPIEDVTQSAYIEQSKAENKMDEVTGDPAFTRGETPTKASESATATSARITGASNRIELKVWCAQFTLATMYRDMYRLEKQFGDPRRWIKIMGSEGFEHNFQHTEIFTGDYEFDYTLGGYMGNRMADFAQFIQGMGILKDIPGVVNQFDPEAIARVFAEKSNIKGIDRMLKKPGIMDEGYYRDPYDENRRMLYYNQEIEVLPGERHTKHIPAHVKLLDVAGLPPGIKMNARMHVDMHKMLLMEDQRAQGSVGGQVAQLQRMIGQMSGGPSAGNVPASIPEMSYQQAAGAGGITSGGENARFQA
jgi:hypothetical protein